MVLHIERLSTVLLKARTRKGYSQTYLAQKLGISQKAYSYIESGHCRLEINRFLKIAHITETHPMQFIEKIIEGVPSWKGIESKDETNAKEIEKLIAQIVYLKSENLYLRGTIDKLIDKQKEK